MAAGLGRGRVGRWKEGDTYSQLSLLMSWLAGFVLPPLFAHRTFGYGRTKDLVSVAPCGHRRIDGIGWVHEPGELDGCGGGGETSRVFRRSAMATNSRTRIGRRHLHGKIGVSLDSGLGFLIYLFHYTLVWV